MHLRPCCAERMARLKFVLRRRCHRRRTGSLECSLGFAKACTWPAGIGRRRVGRSAPVMLHARWLCAPARTARACQDRYQRAAAFCRRLAACAGKCLADRADHEPADEARIAETDIRLSRMHVHVHQVRIEIDEECRRRVPVAREEIGLGAAQSPGKQAVAHRPAIDIEILPLRIATVEGGEPGQTR